jgi:hypothetical protein
MPRKGEAATIRDAYALVLNQKKGSAVADKVRPGEN